jgi:hypothetical protein
MGNGGSHDADVELKGNGDLIYEDALIIAYSQIGKVLVTFTPKECDCIVDRAKQFKWEGHFLYECYCHLQHKTTNIVK